MRHKLVFKRVATAVNLVVLWLPMAPASSKKEILSPTGPRFPVGISTTTRSFERKEGEAMPIPLVNQLSFRSVRERGKIGFRKPCGN